MGSWNEYAPQGPDVGTEKVSRDGAILGFDRVCSPVTTRANLALRSRITIGTDRCEGRRRGLLVSTGLRSPRYRAFAVTALGLVSDAYRSLGATGRSSSERCCYVRAAATAPGLVTDGGDRRFSGF